MPTDVDRQAISQAWTTFASASAAQRMIILQGLLSSCCTSQLSYLAKTIDPLLRVDFTAILPPEICVMIMSHLDAQSLCAACQVSRRWRALADDDQLWHRMCQQHIDKKCVKCGWGLPLMQKRRVVRLTGQKRRYDDTSSSEDDHCQEEPQKKPWKRVYSERLVVERNWRKQRMQRTTLKQDSPVLCLQYCDAQRILITGSRDNTATVWNLDEGKIIRVLEGHTRPIRTLQFDDTKLVTGSLDHTLKVWDYNTGRCIRTLQGHSDGVVHLHFNSRILASGSTDATIKIWNFETGQCSTLTGHTDAVTHTQIVNASRLISSSADGSIRVWDLNTRACLHVLRGHSAPVQVVSPISRLLVPRSHDCHSESDNFLLSGSLDNTLRIWSLSTGRPVRTLFGHTQGVTSLAHDKLRLVSGSLDGSVKLWDMETGLPLYTLLNSPCPVTSVILTDAKVISAFDNGEIHVLDFSA